MTGWPEQFIGRAADGPPVADHPTDQIWTRDEHVGRRDGWHGLGQQQTHLRDAAMTHPAQQLRGGNSARLEPGLRVAGVRAERLHLGDRRPG